MRRIARTCWLLVAALAVWATLPVSALAPGAPSSRASEFAAWPIATPPSRPKEPEATPVPQVDLAPGRLLVATRQLQGPFFSRTVVLLLDYSPTGALGLIVNRPTSIELKELLPALEQIGDRQDRVYMGGPVEPQLMVFLIRSEKRPPGSQHVIADIHATGSAQALRGVVERGAPESRFHAYVGYAGWGPGQLDAEVARGDWYVAPADPEHVFDPKVGDLWERLIFEHEGVRVRGPLPQTAPAPTLGGLKGETAPRS